MVLLPSCLLGGTLHPVMQACTCKPLELLKEDDCCPAHEIAYQMTLQVLLPET